MKKLISFLMFLPLYTNSEIVTNEFPKVEVKETKVEEKVFTVKATLYHAKGNQCDSIPNETASGFIIDTLNAFKHRIIAVSRDLKAKYPFGTKVKISGLKPACMNGQWIVRDVMNKRFKNKIDFLVDPEMKFSRTSWESVKIELI
jgi:3D (Asp-Asp-Asp) domain-containing protein